MADWLSRQNHNENNDEEIKGMQISINAIQLMTNKSECMAFNELKEATSQDQHLQQLMEYIIQGWPGNKDQLLKDIRTYWMFRDDMVVIDGIVIKGQHIVISEALQHQALKQLHINYMDIEKQNY